MVYNLAAGRAECNGGNFAAAFAPWNLPIAPGLVPAVRSATERLATYGAGAASGCGRASFAKYS